MSTPVLVNGAFLHMDVYFGWGRSLLLHSHVDDSENVMKKLLTLIKISDKVDLVNEQTVDEE